MKTLTDAELITATGGMRLDGMRLSTNIEDRRSAKAKARDQAWWESQHPPVPLPRPRPDGI